MINKIYIDKFVTNQNKIKKLLTPGPASLLPENLMSMQPCFGRGDAEYKKIELSVLNRLKNLSKHKYIARLQGSASLALEILASNFLYGKVLIIDTGVYSERIKNMSIFSKSTFKNIKEVKVLKWNEIKNFSKNFDWIFACSTETSIALRIPIKDLHALKKRCKAKLALDATASIGLEKNHYFADVLAYSSCKGLFGLTGASFIAFNKYPENKVRSFYLNIFNHLESKMTGPYHAILSLFNVLPKHNEFKHSVLVNKKKIEELMGSEMVYPKENQPLLCTYIKKKLTSNNKKIIFYKTRANLPGTVVCHLGEIHLKKKSKGNILKELMYEH